VQRLLDEMADDDLTAQIDASLADVDQEHDADFVRVAAARTLARDDW
jgi:hypothetical protein